MFRKNLNLNFGQNSKFANNVCELKKDTVFYPSYEINRVKQVYLQKNYAA